MTTLAPPQTIPEEVAAPATIDSLCLQLGTYLSAEQIERVRKAFDFAAVAHATQRRRTGHAYITHPLAVATELSTMRMDTESIMAALLHDVLEDCGVTKPALASEFGKDVAEIVDGVSKLKEIFKSKAEAQAENFQKMAMAMARDLRVILVKLADRLHNMRTLRVLDRDKQHRIARETLDFYAPIANRLGMHAVRVEMEDLAFAAIYPLRSERIGKAIRRARGNRRALVEEIERAVANTLQREGIPAGVTGREKHLYAIYSKMKTQRKSFSEIMDVYGFRIVVDRVDTCYRALGVVHNLYKPVAGRFKDYIAIPKANGYQSLHTTLFGPHGVHIEIQIRTYEMEAMAEKGIAGHWLYKQDNESASGSQVRARQWVKDLLDMQQQAGSSLEFVENVKLDLFPDAVYVFTPRGKIFALPRGACPVDFAYAVHTQVGDTCVACRVDRQLAPLSTQLQSGQTVEVLTAKDGRPNPDWLTFVVTAKARSSIRHALKQRQRSESIALGRSLLNRALSRHQISIKTLDFRRMRRVFTELGVRKLDDLLAEIGLGNRVAYMVARRLASADSVHNDPLDVDQGGPVTILGSEGMVVSYGKCCHPVPGDAIVGHISAGKGLVVHIETCNNMVEFRRRAPDEIIPVRWSDKVKGEFHAALRIDVKAQKGVIAEMAGVVASMDAGIDRIGVEERGAELSTVVLELSVRDRIHLARVMRRLRNLPRVTTIYRTKG